ncbi:uncharacterized protein LOC111881031 [Lactuca sativa]|uniref:uncharacterized protein LOC111881031 n=1 Tax=Lactuca sativa TaxID=4236 RepID=UPI000CD96E25|nr:uncharacterized protein LOC111881031 [Lactuca sativa]
MVIINGQRSPISFTTAMLSASIMMMMMATMVKECDGWMTPCNGSTTVECIHVVEFDKEIEFQMDTEINRWIMGEAKNTDGHIGYQGMQQNQHIGGDTGSRSYNVGNRKDCKAHPNYCQ